MNQAQFEQMMKLISSSVDAEAVMGLRSLHRLFEGDGITLAQALRYAVDNIPAIRAAHPAAAALQEAKPRAAVSTSDMPQCRVPKAGHIEIILAGKTAGTIVQLQGAAAAADEEIALHMKDVFVAAVLNRSRFKLKLKDITNSKGEVVETLLQAEYERDGMAPVPVWKNVKGEVAALATLLRKTVAAALPDLVA